MKFSLRLAREHNRNQKYGAAVANYMGVLKFHPSHAKTLENEFLDCLIEFVGQLEFTRKIETANEYFSLVSEFYSSSNRFLTLWGEFLARQRLYEEAALCFMKAIELPSTDQGASQSLRRLRRCLIDQWHFRMLNDNKRNDAYKRALGEALKVDDANRTSVLDIGSGTGILSILAAQAGASNVYACEHSTILCEISKNVLEANKMTDNVKIFERNSKDLCVPTDLPQSVDVVVTELMDAGFYGEGIVDTLLDAKRRLLNKNGVTIPMRARIYGCLVECPAIRRHHTILQHPTVCSSLCIDGRNSDEKPSEPYDSLMLNSLRGGYRWISQPFIVDEINLNEEADLQQRMAGLHREISATVDEEAYFDSIVCWFDVELQPGISLCSHPDQNSSWEQAIFPVQYSDLRRQKGDTILMRWSITSNWMDVVLVSEKSDCSSNPVNPRCDSALISLANDDILLNTYRFFATSPSNMADNVDKITLDLIENVRLSKLATTWSNKVIAIYAEKPAEILRYLSTESEKDKLVVALNADSVDKDVIKGKRTTMLCCPIDADGMLRENALEDIAYHRLRFNVARVIPENIDVFGFLIESDQVRAYARADDQNTLGLTIADSINLFDIDIHRDLELSTLQYRALSKKCKLLTLNLNQPLDIDQDQLPSLLSTLSIEPTTVTDGGVACALIFWFEFSCASTSVRLNTSDPLTQFNVAAALTSPINLTKGDTVMVKSTLERSELSFSLSKL